MHVCEWRAISGTAVGPGPKGDGPSTVAVLTKQFDESAASIRELTEVKSAYVYMKIPHGVEGHTRNNQVVLHNTYSNTVQ